MRSSVNKLVKEKYNTFEKTKTSYEYAQKSGNWLCVCLDFLRQDCRVHKLVKTIDEIMENNQTNNGEETFACEVMLFDHIYMFKKTDDL